MTTRTIKKIEDLINETEPFLLKLKISGKSIKARQELRTGEYTAYTASVLHFLNCILDKNNPYVLEYQSNAILYNYHSVQNGRDILNRVLQDVKNGWLLDLKGLISAEIFNDFLEMAKHLLDENYKDPAAVIIGSVLEEHLRKICSKNAISITQLDSKGKAIAKKTSMLNDDLVKGGVYNNLEQKSVISWLDLRNKAAHGKYVEYDIAQVKHMHQGVLDFIVRNPA
jgi:hypothetical protein